MRRERTAVVVGAGPNGLVAANLLADAGWAVLVLEAQSEIGGAVRSARDVHPEFIHDTFSSFYPLAAASPVIRGLALERHGLRWRRAPAVLGHPLRAGGWALLHADRHDTARGLDESHPGDGEAWLRLCAQWDRIGPGLVQALLTPFPPVRGGLRTALQLPRVGGLQFVRTLLEPALSSGAGRFAGEGPALLIAGNALHADIPLAASGSALLGLILTLTGQQYGFPVPAGGAGELAAALGRRLAAGGGSVRCSARVSRVIVDRRRVVGVELDGGERIATRAVVADVHARSLYGGLVAWSDLPSRTRIAMDRFEDDPATVKVDWALSSTVPWAARPAAAPGTVHLAASLDHLAAAQAAVISHRVPAEPFLLAGQMSTADPSRSPAGTESFWAYTHVPQRVRGDDGADGLSGSWDADEVERMADRMQAQVERYAPGFASTIIARRVLGPHEFEERDANLLGGSLGGGTAGLHQQLVFRPVPGLGRAETPVRGLFLASSSAHPGGGVHGACGANAARALLAAARLGRL